MLCTLALFLITPAMPVFPQALVEFTACEQNPVFEAAGPGHWDEHIRERGWILYEGGLYHLWYTGYTSDKNDIKKLGYASSTDGIRWERHPENPIYGDNWTEDMMVLKVEGTYYMFAEGQNDETHLLTSIDRIHWQEHGRITINKMNGEPIAPGPFGTPTAWHENGAWYLFYERNDDAIWLATSTDLKTWTNVQDAPVLERGPDDYDKEMIALDQVVKQGDTYYAYYHGLVPNTRPDEWTSAVAASKDLIHWEKYPGNPIVRGDKSSPVLVQTKDGYRLYTMHPSVCVYEAVPGKKKSVEADKTFTLWQLPNGDAPQMMSYVLRTKTGKLIVIDGGYHKNTAYLREFLKERGGKVEAWFLTHPHEDHCEALIDLLRTPEGLEIEALYASLPEQHWFETVGNTSEQATYRDLMAALEESGRTFIMPAPGDQMNIDGITIHVLGVCNPEITANPLNNSSMVLRFDDGHKSVLFLGDLGVEGGQKLLESPQAALLPSDYVQMAHHGQNGVGEAVYQKINPHYCLWPTPKWLWDNNSGAGEDSGPWRTKEVRGWMQKMPIKKHYLLFEGLQTIK